MGRIQPHWEGKDIWIIGGGSSILEQLEVPRDMIDMVKRKEQPVSCLSKYFKAVQRKKVIGINASFLLGRWVDYTFFADERFWQEYEKEVLQHPSIKVTCNARFDRVPIQGIVYLEKDTMKRYGIHTNPSKISWNGNSGCAAISLANHLGAKRIFLLGFDMNGDVGKTHFHDEYYWQADKIPPFQRHLVGIEDIKQDADRLGIEIINCSPNSAIKIFKKMTYKEALEYEKA